MKSRTRSKFNLHRVEDSNTLIVFRNHKKELVIESNDLEDIIALDKYLRKMLSRDYDEYLSTYDIDEDYHLGGYIINLVSIDTEAAELFQNVRTKVKK